jgi:hypothetical protein
MMETSTSTAEVSAGGEWKNGAVEAANPKSADGGAPSKELISTKNNSHSSPTAKAEGTTAAAPTHTSPKKRRKVNHGNQSFSSFGFDSSSSCFRFASRLV